MAFCYFPKRFPFVSQKISTKTHLANQQWNHPIGRSKSILYGTQFINATCTTRFQQRSYSEEPQQRAWLTLKPLSFREEVEDRFRNRLKYVLLFMASTMAGVYALFRPFENTIEETKALIRQDEENYSKYSDSLLNTVYYAIFLPLKDKELVEFMLKLYFRSPETEDPLKIFIATTENAEFFAKNIDFYSYLDPNRVTVDKCYHILHELSRRGLLKASPQVVQLFKEALQVSASENDQFLAIDFLNNIASNSLSNSNRNEAAGFLELIPLLHRFSATTNDEEMAEFSRKVAISLLQASKGNVDSNEWENAQLLLGASDDQMIAVPYYQQQVNWASFAVPLVASAVYIASRWTYRYKKRSGSYRGILPFLSVALPVTLTNAYLMNVIHPTRLHSREILDHLVTNRTTKEKMIPIVVAAEYSLKLGMMLTLACTIPFSILPYFLWDVETDFSGGINFSYSL